MGALFNAQTSNLENRMNDKPHANGAMIKMLVNVFGVSPNEYESEHQQTLLHYAAWAGNAEAAQALIELGAEVDAKTLDGHTPLLCRAAALGRHRTGVDRGGG
ncbi:ankyrin repeat domain-containing protein [Burkholderia sp. 1A5]